MNSRQPGPLSHDPIFGPMPKDGALTVLVVDNNPVDRALICSYFESLGIFPDSAAHGREALSACGARAYRLILMNCNMPVMDGLAAAKEIRAAEAGKAARSRIVGMIAGPRREEAERDFPEGMDGLLVKPFDIHHLREHISAALRDAPRGATS